MKIKVLMAAIVLAIGSFFGALALSGEAQAADDAKAANTCPTGSVQDTYTSSLAECNIPTSHQDDSVTDTVVKVINAIVSVLGLVTVAVIVIGGITYVTSQGDAAKATKAKNTILYGVVGLIVALLAFAIVNFVSKSVFGSTATTGEQSSEEKKDK